ncbi:NuA4 histone acetyltransferase subunit [Pyricularia oryzae]|uniref:NuA4 histone acetyltransferase subunit n=5 Tax=Pyricularia TaxID=48558 RepID=A0ABQ8NG93_PYRGI|nr:actl6a protein [Pyricularia oryzae 70-15]ELQ42437.1 actl6a protein [Pyricularia oryzae Y34]KAH8836953.1 NuA4 histone acetyltransferase subunit [Pyricularia oryzae]KAI6296582.1 NuA4 histone acetyltransferase subunit [Pyricularia grisea]EHA54339.1 actl6a protein [Pyricularia oryzae 70-15]KAH9438391.1 NuA4 histone acetyltransferase subunit [Pyricularia oryzae]
MAQPLSSAVQPTDIYGGDEVSALVLDPGYCYTRAGFAGEDVPKSVLPSFYGHTEDGRDLFGDDVMLPRPGFEVRNYLSRESIVEDWDVAQKMWEHMLVKRMQPDRAHLLGRKPPKPKQSQPQQPSKDKEGDVEMGGADGDAAPAATEEAAAAAEEDELLELALGENPLLMTESPWNTPKAREKAIELAMEGWGVPAFWLTKTPVLAAFAAGKATALVVDCGGANTSVTAVHDGMVLKRSVQRSQVGGLWLSDQIRRMWDSQDPRVRATPHFMVENKTPVDAGVEPNVRLRKFDFDVHPSFRAYEEERLLTEFKESVVEVWRGPQKFTAPGTEDYIKSQPGRVFEMPDGYNQMWREQRYKVAEGMWDEAAAYPAASGSSSSNGNGATSTPTPAGAAAADGAAKVQTIPDLISACLNGVDQDLRPNLLANVVVTGSTSLLNGFNDRLNGELSAKYPTLRVKLHAAGLTTERRFGSWIGGSILSSLGTFHQMWISRKEYEENGPGIVEKRCK